ncbi:pyruvate ferredoxin oxidoreductase [Niameybacter massiliensis]|uniref:Pyruvate ferredoxin oxidoreductase n=1 Tax=Holtiella tumoricola TaxID=3018743 RepID=A0AA42DK35_9FIRM|nr:pyruvate ferredoxin oxidoreductase [Holtiella tumoricola]MDA3730507.1 pyruvate ferredoxin oxidoreductase [Holtiella tumoricola]
MAIREKLSGNEAVAVAMRQINPGVVAAFPITPSTEVPQYFSSFVNNGQVDTEFVPVESEHSAMSACIGASAAGVRAMTATSANGLALMWEMLYIAASSRLPIVMATVNRALSGPINIHNDHADSMGARDSGWIQIYGENNQEAYDNELMAVRIGEHPDVLLPVMNCYDGFITSHAIENIDLIEDDVVRNFVGTYRPENYLLNPKQAIAVGPLDLPNYYFEHKRNQAEGMRKAKQVILDVSAEFEKLTGRSYGLFEEYMMDDAEKAIVIIGSTAGTAKAVVNELRAKGEKVGLIKVRVFRPFPAEEMAASLAKCKAVAVLDKCDGFTGKGAPLFNEVCTAMYFDETRPLAVNYIYGLGGRDVRVDDIEKVYNDLTEIVACGKVNDPYRYLGVVDAER